LIFILNTDHSHSIEDSFIIMAIFSTIHSMLPSVSEDAAVPEPGSTSLAALIGLLTLSVSLTAGAEASPDCRDAKAEARYTQLQPGVFLQLDDRKPRSGHGERNARSSDTSGTGIFVDVRTRPDGKPVLVACTDCGGVRTGNRVSLCTRSRGAGDAPALQPLTPVIEARRSDSTGLAQGNLE
jgi:hypothetical protein